MAAKFGKELLRRGIVSGLALALLVVVVILAPYPWFRPIFGLGVAAVAAVALWEYYQLSRKGGHSPALWAGIICAVLYIAIHFWQTQGQLLPFATPLALGLAILALFGVHAFRQVEVFGNLAISVFGLLYVVVPVSLLLDVIYTFPATRGTSGWWWFFFVVGVTVLTDMGGYFVGKLFGRRKLAPRLSPNKTVEGAIGGVIFGVIVGALWYLAGPNQAPFWEIVVLAAVISVAGQIGDLLESLLKRDVQAKDSNSIPGLGGMLDVLDSLLLTGPVVYVFLKLFHGGVA